jgi:UDP-N-acetylglucosamine transferase subunit ALG13
MTTMFVATTGGHLEQLHDLAVRLPPDEPVFWVTHENDQSRSLLAGRDVVFVPYVHARNVPDVLQCMPTAHRLWRERSVTRVVSTGSAIAIGYLPYLAGRGVACHYVESAARVAAPSLAGRVLRWAPRIRRYTQHERWADRHWLHRGSVFDSYEPFSAPRAFGDVVRVVVTLGTAAEFPFRRLVESLAPLLAPAGHLAAAVGCRVEVIWQTGCTSTDGIPVTATPYLAAGELAASMASADIVVAHAGTGSAVSALRAGRCPLLVPRRAALGEAADDHQRELAMELAARHLALYREPAGITVDDLLATMQSGVRRSATPPAFELAS